MPAKHWLLSLLSRRMHVLPRQHWAAMAMSLAVLALESVTHIEVAPVCVAVPSPEYTRTPSLGKGGAGDGGGGGGEGGGGEGDGGGGGEGGGGAT